MDPLYASWMIYSAATAAVFLYVENLPDALARLEITARIDDIVRRDGGEGRERIDASRLRGTHRFLGRSRNRNSGAHRDYRRDRGYLWEVFSGARGEQARGCSRVYSGRTRRGARNGRLRDEWQCVALWGLLGGEPDLSDRGVARDGATDRELVHGGQLRKGDGDCLTLLALWRCPRTRRTGAAPGEWLGLAWCVLRLSGGTVQRTIALRVAAARPADARPDSAPYP